MNKKISLWSFQPINVVEQLNQGETFICDPKQSELLQLEKDTPHQDFHRSYKWISEKLSQKYKKPDNVSFPIWSWYKTYGKHKKPDLRQFSMYDNNYSLIELSYNENEVLLSNFDLWHSVLNNSYCAITTTGEEESLYTESQKYFDELLFNSSQKQIEKSWESIFNIDKKENNSFIQACTWFIKPENVVKIHKINRY